MNQVGYAGRNRHRQNVQLAKQCNCSTVQQQQQQQQGPDISRLHPVLQRQWDHPKNLHLGNVVITPGSTMVVCWTCDQCPAGHPHEWQAKVNNRTPRLRFVSSSGCPFCAGRAVCLHNSLAVNAPVVAAQWSNQNPDQPAEYTPGSGARKVWHCDACGQNWTAVIVARIKHKSGCPHCGSQNRAKQERQPFVTESQHAMKHWAWAANQEAGLDPHKLTWGSNKMARWICHKCPRGQPHRWTAIVRSVCKGTGCPCCCGQRACICNSLASLCPDIAAEWDHSRNEGTPDDYPAQSGKTVWWHNSKRGSFEATVTSRTWYKVKPHRYA